MKIPTLKDLFLGELRDMYDAEHRIAKALPKMAKAATCPKLQAALQKHLKETKGHITNLEQVFRSIGEKAKGKKCETTVGLLREGDEIATEFRGSSVINAAIIAAGQKVEHYEIASYGCLREWAELLGHNKAEQLLKENLEQEKSADKTLTELARSGDNEEARDGEPDAHEDPAGAKKAKDRSSTKSPRRTVQR